ncbi:hypothetical protein FG386_000500 [Cryptosporidium ryanae]|uniref:uncharacterized protein n=1 Tax=Cryptosporidium ryanae TaxID=515981 RepID=UPI003519D84C|nr:hypothetical protein FG386_000500 [Cryptosporidium ryanae]
MSVLISINSIRKCKSFVIVLHPEHGYLLLESNKSRNRHKEGENYQLPGGRLDIVDFNVMENSPKETLFQNKRLVNVEEIVFKSCVARELYEETGLDYRKRLEKFEKLNFNSSDRFRFFVLKISNKDNLLLNTYLSDNYSWSWSLINILCNNYCSKFYNFVLCKTGILTKCSGDIEFYLKLSSEHKSFLFENRHEKIPIMIKNHSKGICSKTFERYILYGIDKQKKTQFEDK